MARPYWAPERRARRQPCLAQERQGTALERLNRAARGEVRLKADATAVFHLFFSRAYRRAGVAGGG